MRICILGGGLSGLSAALRLPDSFEVTLLEHRFHTVATPSGKGAYYLPSLCAQKVILDDIETLLERYA